MKFNLNSILIALLSILLFSCSIERKIAMQYINQDNKGSILIFTPDIINKINLKEYDSVDFEKMTDYQEDSMRFFLSDYLQYLSDSVLLTNYVNSYIQGLKNYGYEIYTQAYIDLFMEDTLASYVINIAQIEIEEFYYEVRDQQYFSGELYYADHNLNALNFNSWFEIKKLNSDNDSKNMLFATNFISDDLYSSFKQYIFSAEVEYDYEIDTLRLNGIYKLTESLGKLYADYTNDYLMNEYISSNLPDGESLNRYFSYDLQAKTIVPANENRFEALP